MREKKKQNVEIILTKTKSKLDYLHTNSFFEKIAVKREGEILRTPFIGYPFVLHSSYTIGSTYLRSIKCRECIHLRVA